MMSLSEEATEVFECVCNQTATMNNSFQHNCDDILSSLELFHEALNMSNCSYNGLFDYYLPKERPYPEEVAMSILFSLVMAAGLMGNTLVIYVVVKHGVTRSITNLYFVSLAVADFIYLLFCIPVTIIVSILPYWSFGQITCKLVNYLYVVAMGTSVFTMAAMAVDRYQTVVKHVQAKLSRTVRRTTILLLGIWAVNMILCSPTLFIYQVKKYFDTGEEQNFCTEYYPMTWMRPAYIMAMLFVYYIFPLGLIAVCYLLMALHLRRHVHIREPARSRNKKVSKILLVVVTTFAFCWLPINIIYIVRDWMGVNNMANYISKFVAQFLTYLNSCLNPIIYSFMSDSFRQCFREVLGCAVESEGPISRGQRGLGFDHAFTPVTGTPAPSPAASNQGPHGDIILASPEKSQSNSSNSDINTARLTMTTIVEFKNEAARFRVADVTISTV